MLSGKVGIIGNENSDEVGAGKVIAVMLTASVPQASRFSVRRVCRPIICVPKTRGVG
jgi:hypothetical protein